MKHSDFYSFTAIPLNESRITFRLGKTIQVFRLGKTTNKKIADSNDKIVQSYTYSIEQFRLVQDSESKFTMQEFFNLDSANCMDCPLSNNQTKGVGKCYTHKVNQYKGFLSQIRSIINEFGSVDYIPEFQDSFIPAIATMATNRYIRFGTYGEPSLHPKQLVQAITDNAKNWTGYTHQWKRYGFEDYFMASAHSEDDRLEALKVGYRSFVANEPNIIEMAQGTQCPASEEAGFVSNCSKCGLCSGLLGKGDKSVKINIH